MRNRLVILSGQQPNEISPEEIHFAVERTAGDIGIGIGSDEATRSSSAGVSSVAVIRE